MQIRYATDLSAEQYVQQQAWQTATLNHCPLHPQGGCRFSKHGTYPRKFPEGTKIARWYCPDGHMSFSLLPDCLASRLPGTLLEIEDVVAKVENSPSQEAAADGRLTRQVQQQEISHRAQGQPALCRFEPAVLHH